MTPHKPSEDFLVRYTNKDIMDKLNRMDSKIESHYATLSAGSQNNRKLIFAGFGFSMFILGLVIKLMIN